MEQSPQKTPCWNLSSPGGNFLFYWGFLLNSPFLVAYKLRIISNQAAKEKMLRYYFKEMPVEQFNEHCDRFARNVLPRLIRSAAQAEIDKLKQNGFTIVIVSASPENWIKDWARNHSLQVIATRLTLANGKITGMIAGKNCHGEEKARRIKEDSCWLTMPKSMHTATAKPIFLCWDWLKKN
ncbi:MAG: haloacid dehalogenase-like hydrolase [Saprospiraceae bacterium]|nr:haloacid dehalogenase-like hydrolase [Saprospiraceae bacterium]